MDESAPTPPRTLLLCSLGTSWAVIPEVYGWLAPRTLDLYAHHPDRAGLDATRARHGLLAPDGLYWQRSGCCRSDP